MRASSQPRVFSHAGSLQLAQVADRAFRSKGAAWW